MGNSKSRHGQILVVDDEAFIREAIELYFASEGYQVSVAANADEALKHLQAESFDVAILDIVMPGMNGVDLLREMKRSHPDVEVIMASGNGTLQTAVEAMRLGAYDYITKPILNFDEDLLKVVRKAMERRRLLTTNRDLARDLQEINLELKNSNKRLRRRLAELELVCETGKLIGEVEGLDDLWSLVEGTLRYQLEIAKSILVIRGADGWKIQGRSGLDDGPGAPTIAEVDDSLIHSEERTRIRSEDSDPVAGLLRSVGVADLSNFLVTVIPLRAGGEAHGLLVALESDTVTEEQTEGVPLLQVLATQLAPCVALLAEGVAP